jgi:heme exporter protein D
VYALIKPTWGEAAFVLSAIGLAVACVIVLGTSVYVLARIWKETLKERKRKKEVKQ